MVERLALAGEARGAVGHDALALGSADGAAEVGLSALAELALAALGGVEGDDVVADLDIVDVGADRLDDTTALVAEDDGEGTLGVLAGQGVVVAARVSSMKTTTAFRVGTAAVCLGKHWQSLGSTSEARMWAVLSARPEKFGFDSIPTCDKHRCWRLAFGIA